MTTESSTSPGWYNAAGDPPGTHRYWDGAQWVGPPQMVAAQPAPDRYAAAPSGAPVGYVPFNTLRPGPPVRPAPIGRRLMAYLIDVTPIIVAISLIIVGVILFADASAPFTILGVVAIGPYVIWNFWWRRGREGQSIGDRFQNIRVVETGFNSPPGAGTLFLRYFLSGLISNFTCGIFGVVDILWPLWDDQHQRLADKMTSVIVVES